MQIIGMSDWEEDNNDVDDIDDDLVEVEEEPADDDHDDTDEDEERQEDDIAIEIVRKTTSVLTKFEIARLIGTRAQMIANGAPRMVNAPKGTTPREIAEMELKANKMPLIIRRWLSKGNYEDVVPSDLFLRMVQLY